MALRTVLTGVGSYLPARIVTNAELSRRIAPAYANAMLRLTMSAPPTSPSPHRSTP